MTYEIVKAAPAKRITTSVLYPASTPDAHHEFATPDALEGGLHHLIATGDRRIRLQHRRDVVAGELVGAIAWPYPVEAELIL